MIACKNTRPLLVARVAAVMLLIFVWALLTALFSALGLRIALSAGYSELQTVIGAGVVAFGMVMAMGLGQIE